MYRVLASQLLIGITILCPYLCAKPVASQEGGTTVSICCCHCSQASDEDSRDPCETDEGCGCLCRGAVLGDVESVDPDFAFDSLVMLLPTEYFSSAGMTGGARTPSILDSLYESGREICARTSLLLL